MADIDLRGTSPIMHPLCDPRTVLFAPMELSIACFFAGAGLMIAISLIYSPGVAAIAPLLFMQLAAILVGQREKQILHILAARSQTYALCTQARPQREGKVRIFQP